MRARGVFQGLFQVDLSLPEAGLPGESARAGRGALCTLAAVITVALALLSTGLLTGSARAALPPVTSGNLTASVTVQPWSFELADRRGHGILRERPGLDGTSAGTLGFRIGETWEHATGIIRSEPQGDSLVARLATTDPARELGIRIEPAGHGSVRLQARIFGPLTGVTALGMAFVAPERERYLGFGERSNAVDQRGQVVENWAGEGPYQPEENGLIGLAVPKWGMRTTPDATYFPMPWLLSTAGYGVLIENSEPSYFRLGTDRPDTWSLELSRDVEGLDRLPADAPSPRSISIRFFAGPKPADALRRLTGAIGRQPAPAPWFLGPWVQAHGGEQNTIDTLRGGDVPTSVGQTYVHYLPCGDEIGREQQQLDTTDRFHRNGMAVTTYFNPMICTSYNPLFGDLAATGQLTRDRQGDPYEYDYLGYTVGQFDFSSNAARDSYGNLLRKALDHGYDGWMEDFGEYHPPDAISADATPGMVMHNRYPRDYHCAADEQTRNYGRPVLRYIRSGYTGAAACAPVVWGGDPSTSWGFDGLRSAVTNGLTMGLSGVGVWGSDIGGFFSIASDPLSPELLTRWVQFGAFSGVMRNQADGYQLDNRTRPQILEPDQIDNWRRYSKLRTQLFPYIQAAAADYRRSGLPIMRALALRFPGQPRAVAREDQYLFGPDLMVAPVLEPGASSRRTYLPRGPWIDLWRSVGYRAGDGSFRLKRARVLKGGKWASIPAPLSQIPVLARAGTLLTTIPADVETLAPYGAGDQEVVNLRDRTARRILAFPRGNSQGRFERRGRLISREGRGSWGLGIVDTHRRTWTIDAAFGSMRRPFRPRCVRLNGKRLPNRAWGFARKGKVFRVSVRPKWRKTRLRVTSRRCRR